MNRRFLDLRCKKCFNFTFPKINNGVCIRCQPEWKPPMRDKDKRICELWTTDHGWQSYTMIDLKENDIFRLFEPDDKEVVGQGVYLATEDAHVNEEGVIGINCEPIKLEEL